MFQFEEINKTPHLPKFPTPTPVDPGDCPVSGCFPPPDGFGGIACYRGHREGLIEDPVEMHP